VGHKLGLYDVAAACWARLRFVTKREVGREIFGKRITIFASPAHMIVFEMIPYLVDRQSLAAKNTGKYLMFKRVLQVSNELCVGS
jgi:hypothetical protein